MAYGWGWTEKKFFDCKPSFLFKTWKGKFDTEARAEKQRWERLRVLGTWVLAPYSKGVTPKSILPLPWDEVTTKESFYERNKDLIPLWDKLDGKKD